MKTKLGSGGKDVRRQGRDTVGAAVRPPGHLSGRFSRPLPTGSGGAALPTFPRYQGGSA